MVDEIDNWQPVRGFPDWLRTGPLHPEPIVEKLYQGLGGKAE